MTTLADIQQALAGYETASLAGDHLTQAAVALVLREDKAGLQVLFIERASHQSDPWSGDLGFPGGKVEATDGSPRLTAERETREEIGLDLRTARLLGRLSDVVGAHLPVRVSCFVYALGAVAPLRLNHEIRDAFWVVLEELANQERHSSDMVNFRDESFLRPAIRLPIADKPVLWGLTYRLVMEFIEIIGLGGCRT